MKLLSKVCLVAAMCSSLCAAHAQSHNANASNTPTAKINFASELVGKFEIIPLDVLLNHSKPITQTILRTPSGPALSLEIAKATRLLWVGETFEHGNEQWLLLSQIKGLSHSFDATDATLALTVPADQLATQKLARIQMVAATPTAIPALITNYDWNFISNNNNGIRTTAGFAAFEHTVSLGATRLSQSWLVGYQPTLTEGTDHYKFSRGDTLLQYDDPSNLKSWFLGDYLAQSQSWNRSVRMFGGSVRRSFAGRPDVLVSPQPTLSGFLVQPSTYEIFVNNKRTGNGDFGSGKFEIDQLPLITGNGDVRIVTKDALGREQVTTVPFSVSPRQFAVGVDDFDVNVGLLRTGLSGKRSDYGDLALSAEYARGLTNSWTVRVSAESSKSNANAGIRNVFSLFDAVTATSDLAISNNVVGQQGWLAGVQSDWRGRYANASINYQQRSADFWRLGEATTDRLKLPKHTLVASMGMSSADWGSLGIAATHERRFDGETTKSITASYSKQLSQQAFLYLSATNFVFSTTRAQAVNALLSYSFDDLKTRSYTTVSKTTNSSNATLGVDRQSTEELPLGLRASVQTASSVDRGGSVGANWQAPMGDIDVVYSLNKSANGDTQSTQYLRGSGAMTVAAGGVYASRRVYDAAVLIDLNGVANVRAGTNGAVERTNSSGFVLSPYATSYQTIPVAFEPSDLPMEADYQTTQKFTTSWPKSVSLVQYELGITPGESLELLDATGSEIATGSTALVAGEQIVIGRNGAMYLPKRPDDGVLQVTTPKGKCAAQLPKVDESRTKTSVLTVTCR